nr:cytochrome P450 [Tanacetum cinerariifolium]
MWDTSKFSIQSSSTGDGFLAIMGNWMPLNTTCVFIVVYAPQDPRKKKQLWLDLKAVIDSANVLSLVMSDFNVVRSQSERIRSNFCHRSVFVFNEFISSSGLFVLPMGESMWGHSAFDSVSKHAEGKYGGIIAMRDTSKFSIQSSSTGDGFLAIMGNWIPLNTTCVFIVVYAPQDPRKKKSVSAFNEFISSSGLFVLPMGGMRFTRMNKSGSKLSKINRILVSKHLLDKWSNSHILALTREFSDHSPLLLINHSNDSSV